MAAIPAVVGKKKKKKSGWTSMARTAAQVLSFLLLPILFIDAYNIFRQLVRSLASGAQLDFASLSPQFLTLVLLLGSALLVGRVFCGWMCAFGSFGDLVHRLGSRWTKHYAHIDEKTDRRLKKLKYLVLLIPIFFALLPGSPDLSATSPWDAFGMLTSGGPIPDFASAAIALPFGLFLLLLITVGSFYIERFFCRYLCPLGAMFSVLSRGRFLTLDKPTDHCGSCRVCTNRCSMGIALYRTEKVSSGECIQCMACVGACPRKNITPKAAERKVQPLAAALAVVCTISLAGLFLSGGNASASGTDVALSSTSVAASTTLGDTTSTAGSTSGTSPTTGSTSTAASTTAPTATSAAAKTARYKDGTYQGTGIGFRNQQTVVSVTIRNGNITAINVVSTGDSQRWFVRAFNTLVQKILGNQAAGSDIVAGATYSSRGIDTAVADALAKAAVV